MPQCQFRLLVRHCKVTYNVTVIIVYYVTSRFVYARFKNSINVGQILKKNSFLWTVFDINGLTTL